MGSRSLLAALLAAAFASLLPPPAAPSGHRKLLVFLLDGFRFDYIDDSELEGLPGFRDIVTMGVKVDYVTPDFPSLSYPNYYTLMTGESSRVCAGMVFGADGSPCQRGGRLPATLSSKGGVKVTQVVLLAGGFFAARCCLSKTCSELGNAAWS